jgi:hypothetical protein
MDEKKKTTLAIVLVVVAIAVCVAMVIKFGVGERGVSNQQTEQMGKQKMMEMMQKSQGMGRNGRPPGMGGMQGGMQGGMSGGMQPGMQGGMSGGVPSGN